MSIFKLRPLAFGCFLLILCLYPSYFLGNTFDIALIAIGSALLFSLSIWCAIRRSRRAGEWLARALPACLCLILCGVVALCSFASDTRRLNELDGASAETELLITEIRYSTSDEITLLAKDKEGELVLSLPVDEEKYERVSVGDTVRAKVTYRGLEDAILGYSERDYYRDKGIFLFAKGEEYDIISSQELFWKLLPKRINLFLDGILEKALNSDTYSLVSAMLLGNKSNLDQGVRRDFSRLGISHILALSGIHISLITALLGAFLSTLRLRRGVKYVTLMSLICAFVCITGFAESAMRAGIMLILFYTLSLFGTESDSVTCLFGAVAIICTLDPYAIFSTSLILSFTAMLGCICSSYYTKGVRFLYRIRPKFLRGIVYSLISSIAVVLFTLPIMAIKFDYVSIFAPIFNIIFVPLLTLLLYIAPFILLIGYIPYLSYIVVIPAELITKLSLLLIGAISKADFLTLSFDGIAQYIGIGIVLLAMVLALAMSKRYFKYIATILATGVFVFVASSIATSVYRSNTIAISSYDAEIRDIIAVESENEVMIIEASRPSRTSTNLGVEYAFKLGYADIEVYVLTDYSSYMLDAIDNVTKRTLVRKMLLPKPISNEEKEIYSQASAILESRGVALEQIPEKYDFGATSVDFCTIAPLSSGSKRCVLLKVNANNAGFTYLGSSAHDIFSDTPERLVRGADVVVFGSYGDGYYSYLTYDLSHTSYISFHGDSRDYMPIIPDNVSVKRHMHKFIFK